MSGGKAATESRVHRWMRARGWHHKTPNNGIRRRVYSLAGCRERWHDWGHRVMALTGSDMGGGWSEPTPPTWWYRLGTPTRQWRTKFPRHPLSTFEVIKDYETFRERTKGLNEDQLYEWQAIGTNQDGELHLGRRYWGGDFYGMHKAEVALLRRYLRMWRRHDWFGLRSWLYSLALHEAVDHKAPFSCGLTPPKGSGGYSHWRCDLRRKHVGPHRFRNYVWDPAKRQVEYAPTDGSAA